MEKKFEIQLYTINTENVKHVGGCTRLEDSSFRGTNECEYADEPIAEIKQNLGIQEKII